MPRVVGRRSRGKLLTPIFPRFKVIHLRQLIACVLAFTATNFTSTLSLAKGYDIASGRVLTNNSHGSIWRTVSSRTCKSPDSAGAHRSQQTSYVRNRLITVSKAVHFTDKKAFTTPNRILNFLINPLSSFSKFTP